MPVVQITLIEGYDADTKARLLEALTASVRTAIGAPLDGITVMVNEVGAADYRRGGRQRTPGVPPPPAAGLVRDFLAAMERRDLDAARAFLGPDFAMVFPGDVRLRRLEDLVAFGQSRYRSVRKTFAGFDEVPGLDETVVYCHGTLAGEWPDGTPFDGIRFIDRFAIRDGLIAGQWVWNDMGEARAGGTTTLGGRIGGTLA